jgi:DedD protein
MGENPRPGLRLVERAILVGVWMVSCAVVYGIGFYTGNRIQERVPAGEDRGIRLPVTTQPPPEGQRPKIGDEFTFYDTLVPTGRADAIPMRPKAGPLRPGEQKPPPATSPKAGDAPQGAETGKVQVASRTALPAKPGTAISTKPTAARSATTPRAKSATAQPSKPGAAAPAKSPTTGAKTGTVPTAKGRTMAARATTSAPPKSGAFTVEATSTRDRSEAEAMRANLARRGFDATVQAVPRDGGTWYRLRVGRYASAEQAEQVMRRLRDREGVSRAYVASQ